MLKDISRTLLVKIFAALSSLVLLFVFSHALGTEGMGQISKMMIFITLAQLFSGFWGGAAIVYFYSRINGKILYYVSQCWAVISGILLAVAGYFLDLVPVDFLVYVSVISIFSNIFQNNMSFILAEDKIKTHNFLSFLQVSVNLIVTLAFLNIAGIKEVIVYLHAMFASIMVPFLVSFRYINIAGQKTKMTVNEVIRLLFAFGFYSQLSSVFSLLSYRLTYYYTEEYYNLSALGIFAVGAQLSEGLWLLPKSIAMVLSPKIASAEDPYSTRRMVVKYMIPVISFVVLGLAFLVIIPEEWLLWLVGQKFSGISRIILLLSPGILSISALTFFSTWFSGSGKIRVNTISALAGLLVVLSLCLLSFPSTIPNWPAVINSLGYMTSTLVALSFWHISRQKK